MWWAELPEQNHWHFSLVKSSLILSKQQRVRYDLDAQYGFCAVCIVVLNTSVGDFIGTDGHHLGTHDGRLIEGTIVKLTRYLKTRLKTLRGMTVVHIGAHHGQEAAAYNAMLARRVCWIEANPETFKILSSNLAGFQANHKTLLHRMLGDEPTEHICINALITESNGDQHEFFRFNNEGASDSVFHLADDVQIANLKETGDVLNLSSNTLDTTLQNHGVDPAEVDVLVLDTQGAELLCLKGAEATLSNLKYLESEVSTQPVYEGGVLYDELAQWLDERGFTRRTRIRKTHCNVLFVNDQSQRRAA